MTWIVFIKDGNENKISGKAEGDQFINFKKRYQGIVGTWLQIYDVQRCIEI